MPGIRFTKRTPGSALDLKGYYLNDEFPKWNWKGEDPIVPGMPIKADHIQSLRENTKDIRKSLLYCSCTCDTTCNCQCQCTCTCTCTCDWIF